MLPNDRAAITLIFLGLVVLFFLTNAHLAREIKIVLESLKEIKEELKRLK